MSKKALIKKLWNDLDSGPYIRVNNRDGTLPSVKEFDEWLVKNA